jgi:hypothetical protein
MPIIANSSVSLDTFRIWNCCEVLKQDLDYLTHDQLQQVADFIAFLKFRDQRQRRVTLDVAQRSAVFTEFTDEDRALADVGMNEYAEMLQQEDQA